MTKIYKEYAYSAVNEAYKQILSKGLKKTL